MTDHPPAPLLDWHDRCHWGGRDAACITCGQPTPLRNDRMQPQHKVCAERVLAEHLAKAADNYSNRF